MCELRVGEQKNLAYRVQCTISEKILLRGHIIEDSARQKK